MDLFTVSTEEHRSGILFSELDELKKALQLFGDGGTRGSRATTDRLASEAPMAAMLMTMVQSRPSSFMRQLFDEIDASLAQIGYFSRHFDYDGQGSFFKTTVNVNRLSDGYVLSLSAAYVGNEPEAGLAETLGLAQGLSWSKVILELAGITGDDFMIDFTPIATRFNRFGDFGLTGEQIASVIAAGRKEEWSSFIGEGGSLMVRDTAPERPGIAIKMDSVTLGAYYQHPWTHDGPVLKAKLVKWSNSRPYEHPRIDITVAGVRPTDSSGQLMPVFDSGERIAIRTTVAALADLMRS